MRGEDAILEHSTNQGNFQHPFPKFFSFAEGNYGPAKNDSLHPQKNLGSIKTFEFLL